jgi:hypothetical protein
MISAIANPFLYGYFNETVKDGLGKIFLLCCPNMNRNINVIYYNPSDIPSLELTLKKHQNGGLASRSTFYQLTSHESSHNSVSNHPSTRLTATSTNHHLSPSFSLTN